MCVLKPTLMGDGWIVDGRGSLNRLDNEEPALSVSHVDKPLVHGHPCGETGQTELANQFKMSRIGHVQFQQARGAIGNEEPVSINSQRPDATAVAESWKRHGERAKPLRMLRVGDV